MKTHRTLIFAVAILTGIAVAATPVGRAEAVDQCTALGGTIIAGECQISSTTPVVAGTFLLDETLHILTGGTLRTASPTGVTINITGSLIMDSGATITGDIAGAGVGAPITIHTTLDIRLAANAAITSNQNVGGSCTTGSRGGNIILDAKGNVTLDPGTNTDNGSKVTSISPCGRGEIVINGNTISIDGDVLSQGTTTQGRGGPISVNATCGLTITDFGSVVSRGLDPGADLVHLQGGCDVQIFGLVASTGPGHVFSNMPPHRCEPPNRPDKPVNSDACVEVWAGDKLVIDARPPHNGEVQADTAQSGGTQGLGWIDLFSERGNISVFGDSTGPFAVHANQFLQNGHGGLITIKAQAGSVATSGRAIQADDTSSGSAGGLITIQAKLNVDLTDGRSQAKGSATGGGSQHGGQFDIRSFGTSPSAGSILTSNGSFLDVTGDTPPDGVVKLTACGTIGFPPGTIAPPGITPIKGHQCDGAPVFPVYVVALPCACIEGPCPCVSSFSFQAGSPPSIELKGTQLTAVSQVRLSSGSCEPNAGSPVPILSQAPTSLSVDATGFHGSFKIISISPVGSCCSANSVVIP